MDCLATATPEQAMRCCNTLGCHSHRHQGHHSQNCCNTAPKMRAVIGQPTSDQGTALSPVTLGVVPMFGDYQTSELFAMITAMHRTIRRLSASHQNPFASSLGLRSAVGVTQPCLQ